MVLVIGIFLVVAALGFLVSAIVITQGKQDQQEAQIAEETGEDSCAYSQQATQSGLAKFLTKVRDEYFALHPSDLPYKPDISDEDVRKGFSMWDNTPAGIKKRTDASRALLEKIKKMMINNDKLKPREKKALFQVKTETLFTYRKMG